MLRLEVGLARDPGSLRIIGSIVSRGALQPALSGVGRRFTRTVRPTAFISAWLRAAWV
jgi:hypothetical protein